MTAARTKPPVLAMPELFVQADVSSPEGTQRVVENVRSRVGRIDILVNNVGSSSAPNGGVLALDDSHWQKALNDNLLAAVRLDRAFLPGMIEQGSGVIILSHLFSVRCRFINRQSHTRRRKLHLRTTAKIFQTKYRQKAFGS